MVRVEGDEQERKEIEEREEGWDTFEIWAVDVTDGGKITRDALAFVKDMNETYDAGDKTKHLKRVRKSTPQLDGGDEVRGCKYLFLCILNHPLVLG
jgi:hypothetical protein